MPFVPETSTPAVPASQEMVIDFPMVTAPKPPGSRQLISPPAAVLEIAPAKVLHGAVRLQGLTSSPTPETQVRVAWASAGDAEMQRLRTASENASPLVTIRVRSNPPCSCGKSIIVQMR